jgi:hypothetical protein
MTYVQLAFLIGIPSSLVIASIINDQIRFRRIIRRLDGMILRLKGMILRLDGISEHL